MTIINSPLVFIDLQAGYYEVLSVWLHVISDTDGLNSLCCCCIVKDVWRTRSSEEARTSTLLRWSSFHTHIPQNRRCRWDWNLWRAAGNRNTSPHSRQEDNVKQTVCHENCSVPLFVSQLVGLTDERLTESQTSSTRR